MSNVIPIRESDDQALTRAAIAFVATGDFTESTRAKYTGTLDKLIDDTDGDLPVSKLTFTGLEKHLRSRYGHAAPATYNRHLATIGSFLSWCVDHELAATNPAERIKRRKPRTTTEAEKQARPIPWSEIDALIRDTSIPIRDRCYWAMLYDTAARADEILSLNVEDLDLANKEAIVRAKGGNAETIYWSSLTARLLPRVLNKPVLRGGKRASGPLFLTSRRPPATRVPATVDLCPATGHARLSYRRAEEIFVKNSRGKTLHQLRHAALTHLAEKGEDMATLKAKSRHKSLRSLERYVNPGHQALRELTDRNDPNRRRK